MKIDPSTATRLRNTIITEIDKMKDLEKRRPTKQNMSKLEWTAVYEMANDHESIIIPADKGDKSIAMDYGKTAIENEEKDTAILDNTTYLSKLQDRITPHEKIDNNPAPKHERRLNTALTKMGKVSNTNEPHNNTGNKPKYILSRESLKNYKTEGAIPPKLKGQLKDHKDGKPLREIADASNSPGHKLAKR